MVASCDHWVTRPNRKLYACYYLSLMVWHKTLYLERGGRYHDVDSITSDLASLAHAPCLVWGEDALRHFGLPDVGVSLRLIVANPRRVQQALIESGPGYEVAQPHRCMAGFLDGSLGVSKGRESVVVTLFDARQWHALHLLPPSPLPAASFPSISDMSSSLLLLFLERVEQDPSVLMLHRWIHSLYKHFPSEIERNPKWPLSAAMLHGELLAGVADMWESGRERYRAFDDASPEQLE